MPIRNLTLAIIAITLTAAGARGQSREPTFDPSLGVDLSTMTRSPTGLYTKVLADGQGEPAAIGARLQVEFTANLSDGSQFSETPPGEPLEFVLSRGTMIPGFTEGLIGFRPGESRLLVIPPAIGYVYRGVNDVVPPGATLVFRVRRMDGMTPAP